MLDVVGRPAGSAKPFPAFGVVAFGGVFHAWPVDAVVAGDVEPVAAAGGVLARRPQFSQWFWPMQPVRATPARNRPATLTTGFLPMPRPLVREQFSPGGPRRPRADPTESRCPCLGKAAGL